MSEMSNKILAGLMLLATFVSLATMFTTLNRMSSFGSLSGVTGFVDISPNATANLSITATAALTFSDATIDWGSGYVNTTAASVCQLDTLGANSVNGLNANPPGCAGFDVVSQGFILENTGTTNLSVALYVDKTAAQYLGGTSPTLTWNVTQAEANSCQNATGTTINQPWINMSSATKSFEATSTTPKVVCQRLLHADASDTLNISINISFQSDAPSGAKSLELVAEGTTTVVG